MATFTLDRAHSQIGFAAKHMMVTNVRGTFTEFDGTLELDETDPTASHAEFRIKVASVDTAFGARDNHLRSADFFDVDHHPELLVTSTTVRHKGGNDYVVTADVTIRAITRSVDFDVVFSGFFIGMDGSRRASFAASAKVNRKDWGLDWNVALEAGGWLVGEQVRLEVDVAAQEAIALAA
jgi:polyisoprenoid-binding protein YceI